MKRIRSVLLSCAIGGLGVMSFAPSGAAQSCDTPLTCPVPSAGKSCVSGQLYDLETDLGEKNNLAAEHPELVKELDALLDAHAENLDVNVRPAGFVEEAKPLISEPGDLPRLRELPGSETGPARH